MNYNKEISCLNCPDRKAEPNCHITCNEYLERIERYNAIKSKKQNDKQLIDYYRAKYGKKQK